LRVRERLLLVVHELRFQDTTHMVSSIISSGYVSLIGRPGKVLLAFGVD